MVRELASVSREDGCGVVTSSSGTDGVDSPVSSEDGCGVVTNSSGSDGVDSAVSSVKR